MSFWPKGLKLFFYLPGIEPMPRVNYAVRLRAPYVELQTTVADWALQADKVLCYEHPDKRENVHCHLLLVGVYISTDTLKGIMRRHGIALKGSGQVSFKTSFKSNGISMDITDETISKYITYMSKGKYDAKYNKGYTQEELDACKARWITYYSKPSMLQEYDDFKQYVKDKEALFVAPVRCATIHVYACEFVKAKYGGFIPHIARKQVKDLKDNYCVEIGLMSWSRFALPFERLEN